MIEYKEIKITVAGVASCDYTTGRVCINDLAMAVDGISPVEWGTAVIGKNIRKGIIKYLKEHLEKDDE